MLGAGYVRPSSRAFRVERGFEIDQIDKMGGIPMDDIARYFIATAATIVVALVGVGLI